MCSRNDVTGGTVKLVAEILSTFTLMVSIYLNRLNLFLFSTSMMIILNATSYFFFNKNVLSALILFSIES